MAPPEVVISMTQGKIEGQNFKKVLADIVNTKFCKTRKFYLAAISLILCMSLGHPKNSQALSIVQVMYKFGPNKVERFVLKKFVSFSLSC